MEGDRSYDDFTDEAEAEEALNLTYEQVLREMRKAEIASRPPANHHLSATLFIGAALMAATQCNDEPRSTMEHNPVEYSVTGATFLE